MGLINWFLRPSHNQPLSPEGFPQTVKMEVGACGYHVLHFTCPCMAGLCISETAKLDKTSLCICGHPLALHKGYNETLSSSPGSSPPRQKYVPYTEIHKQISPRDETVQILGDLLQEHRVMHVRGTPASGKTVLSHLLFDRLSQQNKDVIRIESWDNNKAADIYLAEVCRDYGYKDVQANDILTSAFIFLIDEAQQTYLAPSLWYGLVKTFIGRDEGPQFCLFSVYGSPRNGAVSYPAGTSPPILDKEQRVSLTTSDNPGSPRISLFYHPVEYHDVIERSCRRPGIEFTLGTDLKDYIYALTNGHPGVIDEMVFYLRNYHRSHLKRRGVSEILLSHVQEPLDNDHALFAHFISTPASRSLPSRENNDGLIEPGVVKILLAILRDGSIPFKRHNASIWSCFSRGWIQTEELEGGGQKCFLPSNFHARYVEYFYNRESPRPFPLTKYMDLRDFCLCVLKRFSVTMLQSGIQGRRTGPSGQPRPRESAYQDELYRCYWLEVRNGAGICSEWSGTNSGRIDFYIPGPKWGIELLRDGDRVQEHLNRFKPNKAYHTWVQSGLLSEWLVLDCRNRPPGKSYPNEPNLWRVLFHDNYTRIQIMDCNNQELVPSFSLANH